MRHSQHDDKAECTQLSHEVVRHIFHLRRCYIQPIKLDLVVIAPPIRFSVVDFSENRGNHVKVSTSLGLLLAHLGFFKAGQ